MKILVNFSVGGTAEYSTSIISAWGSCTKYCANESQHGVNASFNFLLFTKCSLNSRFVKSGNEFLSFWMSCSRESITSRYPSSSGSEWMLSSLYQRLRLQTEFSVIFPVLELLLVYLLFLSSNSPKSENSIGQEHWKALERVWGSLLFQISIQSDFVQWNRESNQ